MKKASNIAKDSREIDRHEERLGERLTASLPKLSRAF
jgi:hypothetical protein